MSKKKKPKGTKRPPKGAYPLHPALMFEVYKLNSVGMDKATELQQAFKAFLEQVESVCCVRANAVGGREMAIVRTKLEEASFFANRAMAVQGEHHTEVIG